MIDRKALLSELQSVLRSLEADLLERSESSDAPSEIGEYLRSEHKKARDADRTAQNYEDWRSDFITQVAAAWVLSCVFARFLEDNELIDAPKLSGPGNRLRRARDEHEVYFRSHPTETDREYLLSVFDQLAKLPGASEIFAEHNPIHELPHWLSGDAAGDLLRFFQRIDADTGDLHHDFSDPEWNTRFLGDLYQDLSEAARKKYALLQTPEFVEEFILDQTLEPALDEFGLEAPPVLNEDGDEIAPAGFRMIDPACGSGHFLLGAFDFLLDRWRRQLPSAHNHDLVQRTLNSIYGVDVNPFAVAIARFRLLLAALRESSIVALRDAPAFVLNLVTGDSLLHGTPGREQALMNFHELSHHYRGEDIQSLRRILRPQSYHAVVGNPPYIVVSDGALRAAYRERYSACHGQLAQTVPFFQRFFELACRSTNAPSEAGFVGVIIGSAFSKQQFGKKLVEDFMPRIEMSALVDTAGAYIPGHGTPTIIIFGRNRAAVGDSLRAVMGLRGEPGTPPDPATGHVWSAIVSQFSCPDSESRFISVADVPRSRFHRHPWIIAGERATSLKDLLDARGAYVLASRTNEMGRSTNLGEDEVWLHDHASARRMRVYDDTIELVIGECIRHWSLGSMPRAIYPYDELGGKPIAQDRRVVTTYLWPFRTLLRNRTIFGIPLIKKGHPWYAHLEHYPSKLAGRLRATFASVATHNQFAAAHGECTFKQSAPVIAFDDEVDANMRSSILGALNSSIACFWFKLTLFNKGSTVDQKGARQRTMPFEDFYDFAVTHVGQCPIPDHVCPEYAEVLDTCGLRVSSALAEGMANSQTDIEAEVRALTHRMIAVQEELDWHLYDQFGISNESLVFNDELPAVMLGERAFEIVMARQMAAGELETTWFQRHDSAPRVDLPHHWPKAYTDLVQRRVRAIEQDRNLGLLEQPEYKRRWNAESWDSQLERARYDALVGQLESYFDFDGRMNDEETPTSKTEIVVISIARLADIARSDERFVELGELYRDDAAFDVQALVEELATAESVPLLPVLRYKSAGLRKRAAWEKIWDLQRAEDTIDARTTLPEDDPQHLSAHEAKQLKKERVGDIPVPPKYKSSDFISTGGARYWALRGKLDVPKERWVSFPHCEAEDGTPVIAWAGYDHLQLAKAISAYYVEVQERLGGAEDPRLVPLLACLLELLPWLKQWHNEIDPEFNVPMGDYFEGFVQDEARKLNMTLDEIRAWEPPKTTRRKKRTKKKAALQTQSAEDTDA